MTSFADLFRQAWPDYVVDGVPASGIAQPNKATIRALGQSLDTTFDDLRQILALGGVTVYRTTRALLYADLAHAADTIAAVTLDVTAAYNGIYVKAGASDTGSWSQIFQFTDSASVLASLTAYVDDEIAGEVTARDAAIVAAVTALDDDLTAALGGEETARADADTALDLRLDAAESTLGAVSAAIGARDAAITRVDDGLGILARTWRDQMSAAASGKAINTSGIEVTAVSYAATGYIDVTRTMSITRFGSPMTSGSFVPIAYYDAARALLGTAWTGGGLVTIFDMAESPDGTRYARLCGLSNVSAYI
ncbi:hypothetical protein, partial [Zavarzinia sp.]|uniref:hypothetical protein n=1 Tax=Zavarzinia sp. TaxID=2027920 RepID=UPI003BB5E489